MAITSYAEQRITKSNQDSDILEAKIIANYGDPGLDEDYHFDLLSRYVVVMIASYQRVLTSDKYEKMIAIVRRPETLWVSAASTPDNNPTNQVRQDASQNTSQGIAGSFSSNGISRIYPAYSFGETIRIRKTHDTIQPPNSFFYSAFTKWDSSTWSYGGWHSDGSTLPYFKSDDMKSNLRQKTINPIAAGSHYYQGFMHKMHYEAFALSINQGDSAMANGLASIFDSTWGGNPAVYNANGGYVFGNGGTFVLLNTLAYEDMNLGHKARVSSNDCIPLVVTTPNTFPAPSSRSIGTIIYNPTYSPISQ